MREDRVRSREERIRIRIVPERSREELGSRAVRFGGVVTRRTTVISQSAWVQAALPATTRRINASLPIFLLALASGTAMAQVATGDILGTVTDSSGAAIPGATVQVENLGTHVIRDAIAAGNGSYTFTELQPGTYAITVKVSGFKTYSNPALELVAGDRARVDAALAVGATDR